MAIQKENDLVDTIFACLITVCNFEEKRLTSQAGLVGETFTLVCNDFN